jgi:hypothetical protein
MRGSEHNNKKVDEDTVAIEGIRGRMGIMK